MGVRIVHGREHHVLLLENVSAMSPEPAVGWGSRLHKVSFVGVGGENDRERSRGMVLGVFLEQGRHVLSDET